MSNTSETAAQAIQLIPVSKLIKSPRNVRKTGSKAAHEELKASIMAHGLMQNLVATDAGGGYYEVVAGARRMEALQSLIEEDKLPEDHAVPCQVVSEEQAQEMSLAENVVRLAMHPADQFEAFAALIEQGMTAEQVATRFGCTARQVENSMRLARIAPELIREYRDEKLTHEALAAFAVIDDHARQLAVYKSLHEWQRSRPEQIRSLLTEGMVKVGSKLATFVTLETYLAAGGAARTDLTGETFLENPELLNALAVEKLKLADQELVAEGWSWVKVDMERDWNATAGCRRLQPQPGDVPQELLDRQVAIESEIEALDQEWDEADEDDNEAFDAILKKRNDAGTRLVVVEDEIAALARFDADQMKSAGCYAYIRPDGKLEVEKGLFKREEAKKAAQTTRDMEDDEQPEPKAKGLSDSLKRDLEAYRLGAAEAEIAKHPEIAFDLLVFKAAKGMCSHGQAYDGPQISFMRNYGGTASQDARSFIREGMDAIEKALPLAWLDEKSEAQQFAAFQRLPDSDKHQLLAFCVASTLQPKLAPADGKEPTAYDVALEQTGGNVAEYWRPGAANFLSRIRTDQLLEIGGEIFGPRWAAHRKNSKKAALVAELEKVFAEPEKHAQDSGQLQRIVSWLPEGMAFSPAPEPEAVGAEPGSSTILIATAKGMMRIEADIKDGLAVHKWLEEDDEGGLVPTAQERYGVTHVGSGRAINNKPFASEAAASECRERLLDLGDWGFKRQEDIPDELSEAAGTAMESFRAMQAA